MSHDHLLGQLCALGTAVTWAFAVVLFKRSGEKVPPLALNLFKSVVGLLLLAITIVVMGGSFQDLACWDRGDICVLLLSGIIGIAIADTVFFHALNLMGVGIAAIVDCLYSPFVFLFSVLLLHEELGPFHFIGAGLILGGVLTSSKLKPPENRTHGQLVLGMILGASSMAMMAGGIVMAKPVLADFPLIWATTLRLAAGTAVLALWIARSKKSRANFAFFKPSAVWWISVPASVLGTYLALILWIGGFKYTYASVAAILNQSSTAFAIVLATILLGEPFSKRKFTAVCLALSGVLVMILHAQIRTGLTVLHDQIRTGLQVLIE